MIVDTIGRLGNYFKDEQFALIKRFLSSLSSNMEDGRVEISGEEIFAMVSTYETRQAENSRFEAHRKYIDIQLMIAGEEEIGWLPLDGLAVAEAYDDGKDVAFYHRPDKAYSHITMRPGMCAVFFPEDAHMPQLTPGDISATVRKVVIKVSHETLER